MAKLRRGPAAFLLATLAGCGLAVTGADESSVSSGDAAPPAPGDTDASNGPGEGGGEVDAATLGDARVEPEGGSVDAGPADGSAVDGSPTDAGSITDAAPDVRDASIPVDAGCVPTVSIDDALTTIDTSRWLTPSNEAGHPMVVNSPPGGGGAMVALIPAKRDKRGGLWLKTPVPTRAFDVSFEYYVECPQNKFCADGLAVAWLDTTDATVLDTADVGGTLGLPQRNGTAVTVTYVKNMSSGQTLAPVTFAVRQLTTSTTPPGAASSSSASDEFVQQRRTVELRMRNGRLTAANGGRSITTNQTTSGFTGLFGVTAATGDEVSRVFVSSFHGKFYDCDPP